MKSFAAPAIAAALAVLTFFVFPGHTYLQQDSQIYVPILEHLRDPSLLANDILAQQPHVAFTLFDETARFCRSLTGAGFREVLEALQIVTRAFGIWGLFLMASALGLAPAEAWTVAAIVSLGAAISGPEVLTLEYEPTPRAFAVPLVLCAVGLAAHYRWRAAALAGAAAFLLHPPTAVAFWLVFLTLAAFQGRLAWPAGALAAATAILVIAVRAQAGPGESQHLFTRLTADQEFLQHLRTAYNWISTWPTSLIVSWLAIWALSLAAFARIRAHATAGLRAFLIGLPLLGILSMPASWLLLEGASWSLIPQLQPLRQLLYLALVLQFLAAAAGVLAARERRWGEAILCFAVAYAWPLKLAIGAIFDVRRLVLLAALASATAGVAVLSRRYAPALALAAYLAIPTLGGVVNYPRLQTPELAGLSAWARAHTSRDAVFVFPDAGHSLDPGIFRSQALRAVYVDWKGGGQVNYLRDFGVRWWFRWQQTVGRGFQPSDLARYNGLGISYVVLRASDKLPAPPLFANSLYAVYPALPF